jgi:hypothetical protein
MSFAYLKNNHSLLESLSIDSEASQNRTTQEYHINFSFTKFSWQGKQIQLTSTVNWFLQTKPFASVFGNTEKNHTFFPLSARWIVNAS